MVERQLGVLTGLKEDPYDLRGGTGEGPLDNESSERASAGQSSENIIFQVTMPSGLHGGR